MLPGGYEADEPEWQATLHYFGCPSVELNQAVSRRTYRSGVPSTEERPNRKDTLQSD